MEKFYFFNSFLDTARAIEDESLRLKYLMAIAEYWLEGKESDDPMVKALMVQTQFTLDRSKELSENKAEKMKGNQNARKNWEKQLKQTKTDKNRVKQKKQEEEVEEEVEEENNNKEIIITNSNELVEQSSTLTKDINNLIELIKQECNNLGVAYDKQKDRYFAKFILSAKEYGGFCEKVGMDRAEFAVNVMIASVKIKFRKGFCTWPMKIYQNYADVYNETLKQHSKNQKNLIQSF